MLARAAHSNGIAATNKLLLTRRRTHEEVEMYNKLDLAGFEEHMPNIVRTARRVEPSLKQGRHVILEKPVKAGARKLIECLALRNTERDGTDKKVIQVYATKLDRIDIGEQLDEMKEHYGIEWFKIQTEKSLPKLFDFCDRFLAEGHLLWLHLDEGDYGSGDTQLLSHLFYRYVDRDGVRFIDYSATNEEAILSSFNDPTRTDVHELEAGEHYNGAARYLAKNLVKGASLFWDFEKGEPTEQGRECIELLVNSDKLFGVVRLVSKYKEACPIGRHGRTGFTNYFNELGINVRFVDKDNKFKWGNTKGSGEEWKAYLADGQKVLFVINQTCTRSTEVGFHKLIAFWHDYRNGDKTPYNTRIQAYGRVFHYDADFHHIQVYADIPTFELAAKQITRDEYVQKTNIRLSERIYTDVKKRKYEREFYIEGDPAITFTMTDDMLSVEFTDGREVPNPREDYGDKRKWKCSWTSKWKPIEGERHRDPIVSIIRGVRRDAGEPLTYMSGPNPEYQLSKERWNELMLGLEKESVTGNDGRFVLEALRNGLKVVYHARPLDEPIREIVTPSVPKKSMYQKQQVRADGQPSKKRRITA